jgi:hypothetical protein
MQELGTATVSSARVRSGAGTGPAQVEPPARVRPRGVWRGLCPARPARIRETFVRVLLDALGVVPTPREAGRDAPHP